MLLCRNSLGSVMLLSTWVSAAKFTMASASTTRRFMSFGFRMSPFTNLYRFSLSMSLRLVGLALRPILSTFVTSASGCDLIVERQKLLPMKPSPPVTRIFMVFHL